MSKWVRFRNSITSAITSAVNKDSIIEGGEFANAVKDTIEVVSGDGKKPEEVNADLYDVVVAMLVKSGYKDAARPEIKESIIELINLQRGIMEDKEKYGKNKDYASVVKKKIAIQYIQFTLNIATKILGYLLEKYLMKKLIS